MATKFVFDNHSQTVHQFLKKRNYNTEYSQLKGLTCISHDKDATRLGIVANQLFQSYLNQCCLYQSVCSVSHLKVVLSVDFLKLT